MKHKFTVLRFTQNTLKAKTDDFYFVAYTVKAYVGFSKHKTILSWL